MICTFPARVRFPSEARLMIRAFAKWRQLAQPREGALHDPRFVRKVLECHIQREEKSVQKAIKEATKRNDMGSAKALAKEILMSRKTVNRLYENKAQLNSISMHLGESVGMITYASEISIVRTVGHLFKSAEVIKLVNNAMKVPQLAATMQEFSKSDQVVPSACFLIINNILAGVIEEIVNDSLDSALDSEDIEEETEEEVDKVLSEIASETAAQLPEAVRKERVTMNGFSTVNGFVEKTESLAEMIKCIGNEPSLGLLYVQKTHDAVPKVVDLSNRVVEKSREASLHLEDSEDSITMVRSMKECGIPIVDEMIKDIANSLMLISSEEKLKQGLVNSLHSGFTITRTRSSGPISWSYGSVDVRYQVVRYYFSTLFKSVREKTSSFKWFQVESKEPSETETQKPVRCPAPLVLPASACIGSIPDEVTTEPQNLVQYQQADKLHEEVKDETEDNVKLPGDSLLFVSEDYDDLKADKESKLEQWVEGSEGKLDTSKGESETDGV
ncbi:putative vacuolar protein sorting-associated protein 24-like protein 2 [Hibiscus syriacus]|uniref:Vacuolar protein sorting-associated protein 24-like protein 2 n=1 Tax=Hibiscus syriacus TaxID=106335 RepID=A0A6A2XA81_HIBSY|nr:putative vacuolar protein sorting-associated protein 24-like protein 2 [Hibiscus syriacus]